MAIFGVELTVEYLVGIGALTMLARIIETAGLSLPELTISGKGKGIYYYIFRAITIGLLAITIFGFCLLLITSFHQTGFGLREGIIIVVMVLSLNLYSAVNREGFTVKFALIIYAWISSFRESFEHSNETDERQPSKRVGALDRLQKWFMSKFAQRGFIHAVRNVFLLFVVLIVCVVILGVSVSLLIAVVGFVIALYIFIGIVNVEVIATAMFFFVVSSAGITVTSSTTSIVAYFCVFFIVLLLIDFAKRKKIRLIEANLNINDYLKSGIVILVNIIDSHKIYKIVGSREYLIEDNCGILSKYIEYSSIDELRNELQIEKEKAKKKSIIS